MYIDTAWWSCRVVDLKLPITYCRKGGVKIKCFAHSLLCILLILPIAKRRRKSALNVSSTWSDKDKAEIKLGLMYLKQCRLKTDRNEAPNSDRNGSDSDIDEEAAPRKVIVTSPLSWRSEQFHYILNSLDRKWLRRCSDRSKAMMKNRKIGQAIDVSPPEGLPQWMRRRPVNADMLGSQSQN